MTKNSTYKRNWFFKKEIYRSPGELYLTRYVIFRSHYLSVYIHNFHISDYPVFHDHPANFLAIPLKTGYLEHLLDGTVLNRKPFQPKFRTAEEMHYVEKHPDNAGKIWTLFFFFRKRKDWGFLDPDKGWTDHVTYNRKLGVE